MPLPVSWVKGPGDGAAGSTQKLHLQFPQYSNFIYLIYLLYQLLLRIRFSTTLKFISVSRARASTHLSSTPSLTNDGCGKLGCENIDENSHVRDRKTRPTDCKRIYEKKGKHFCGFLAEVPEDRASFSFWLGF